mmetsp:Transcript_6926/g.7922  ORF Transcript_6926/g.7922 Transcript_6926/m.7922 type:complete len:1045 (+) Transcript_6926:284-3418(+)
MGGDNQHPFGWNAHRHQSSPIGQPRYRFQDVPKCQKSLEGSVIQEISSTREAFKEIMAEMVLLCTDAIKRNRSGRTTGKPLSLEYIADRLDVDDPCFGYIIRSDEGHLQGFITATTFTNWQSQFSWDSLHELSFYYDDDVNNYGDEDGGDRNEIISPSSGDSSTISSVDIGMGNKEGPPQTPIDTAKNSSKKNTLQKGRKRVIDEDGCLAKNLQKTIRLGDPYNEGIVWPRIAEISLLGALGCGRNLVQLVIEQLEFQRATGSANYDYIALQATDNSIPFYESLGFVRVGAVIYDTKQDREEDSSDSRPSSPTSSMASTTTGSSTLPAVETTESGTLNIPQADALSAKNMVSSPNFVHEVVKAGETPNDIAKRYKVCVWDIVFLNKNIYQDLRPTCKLIKGTRLHVPEIHEGEAGNNESNSGDGQTRQTNTPETPTKWFVAKENDTPRKIANQFNIACNKLVLANRRRLPELQATSRLKAGTRVKVSNLNQQDKICQPYCHWSFPDDTIVEGGEPSYMMVYKLDRKTARNPRKVRDSLAVPVGKYSPPRLLFPPPPKTTLTSDEAIVALSATGGLQTNPSRQVNLQSRKDKVEIDNAGLKFPKEPKRTSELKKPPPESGKDIYWEHQKELHPEFIKSTPENKKIIRERWSRLGNYKKERYHGVAAEARKIYKGIEREYKAELSAWKKVCKKIREEHELQMQQKQAESLASKDKENSLFSKVIKLRGDAIEGNDYKYWFVLTYIPDLKWCHLAPMVQEGHFGPERKRSHGRPRYRLVDETLGKELDISSMYCIPVKSKALKRTVDADKEEWDIIDGPVTLSKKCVVIDTNSTLNGSSVGLSQNISDQDNMSNLSDSAFGSTTKRLSKEPKFRARSPIKRLSGKIAIGTTAGSHHSQDLLKRTRSSPSVSGRKRSIEKISLEDKVMAREEVTDVTTPRKRRRCMRCIDNGAPPSQATECQGAKGRFGRDACEYFDHTGNQILNSKEGETKKKETIRNEEASDQDNPKIELTLTSLSGHPDATSSMLKLSANEEDYTSRKSRLLHGQ